MANFDQLAASGKPIFLRYDQMTIIRRLGLRFDAGFLYLQFCGQPHKIDRLTGDVYGPDDNPAGPAVTLAVFDMLCRSDAPCVLAGEWRTTNTLPGSGQTSPSAVELASPRIRRFEANMPALREACKALGGKPFPVGDVAFEMPIFDWFPVVLQFWAGDEEFPSTVRFLWDRDTLRYLHFETLYYIMGHLLELLDQMI